MRWRTDHRRQRRTAISLPCDLSDMETIDALVEGVSASAGSTSDQQCRPVDPAAAGRVAGTLATSSAPWCSTTMPRWLIRGLAPRMLERGDGHIINVATWGVLSGGFAAVLVYNASEGTVGGERIIENRVG